MNESQSSVNTSASVVIDEIPDVHAELERAVRAALETYSNVHRGSGHNSMVSTHLYEQAREIVLAHLGLDDARHTVIFGTRRSAAAIAARLPRDGYHTIASRDIGLHLGITALAVEKSALPKGAPMQSGGGTTKMVSDDWVIWADAPDRFEAGTPAIINVIAFAKALRMTEKHGAHIFAGAPDQHVSAGELLYRDDLEKYSGHELLDLLRSTLIGRGLHVPTVAGDAPYINLDNSASTRTFEPIWDAFRQTYRCTDSVRNDIVREVKSICARTLGTPLDEYDIIFASNTTEAVNIAAEGVAGPPEKDIDPVIVTTLLEHSSNDLPWRALPRHTLIRLSVNRDGYVDAGALDALLAEYNRDHLHGRKRVCLVTVSGASNVLGTCNDMTAIGAIVHRHGAQLLVDGAQLVAHRGVDIRACGIDGFAFSAHKVYAPFGCGVLIVRKGMLHFDERETALIQSSGEENAGGIAALGKALLLLERIGMDVIQREEQALMARMLAGLARIEGVKVYGVRSQDAPAFADKVGVVPFSVKGAMPKNAAAHLAMRGGIGVRYGCHCAHILVKHILGIGPFVKRLQYVIQILFPRFRFMGVVRASLGIENTERDVDTFLRVLETISLKRPDTAEKETRARMTAFVDSVARRVYDETKN